MERNQEYRLIKEAKDQFKDLSDEDFIELYKKLTQSLEIERIRRFDDETLPVEMPDVRQRIIERVVLK
jgi:hypothetical protein